MQIIVTLEVPDWVKERLSVEDNKAAWDWVNSRTACITPETVFGSWPGEGWVSEYERAARKLDQLGSDSGLASYDRMWTHPDNLK